ncbi:S41 family peptidase [Pedobacter sp. PAMC26386]|nr:S41 family peptidase [Pedobacter sp. PAMC26386]
MKTIAKLFMIALFAIAFGPTKVKAQQAALKTDSAHLLLDTILNFTKSRSLYRDKVNWKTVEDSVRATAANATSIKDALPAVQLLYKLLGDHHGFITYKKKTYGWKDGNKPLDKMAHPALVKKIREGYKLTPKRLEKGYAYLLVPDNNPTHNGDIGKIAKQIRDSLALFNPRGLKGIIIDLRLNPGGAMWPMIGGLSALFEPGKLGAFIFPASQKQEEWGIKKNITNSIVYDDTDTVCNVQSRGKNLHDLKVVVLIGPYTCSSGEALAISFKGRKNTWFIGENTGGYTTANDSFQFNSKIGFFLATSVEADRNGQIYLDNVKPDEEITGADDFDNLKNDQKVIAALKWLKRK